MSVEEAVIEKLRTLPVEQQQEVLEFVEFLERKHSVPRSRGSLKGLWADLGIEVADEDIVTARREMWGKFPREDI
jgi:hypothetical protein